MKEGDPDTTVSPAQRRGAAATSASVVMLRWRSGARGALLGVPWLFRALDSIPGGIFHKFCGAGEGGDFSLWPDFSRWLAFIAWRDDEARRDFRRSPLVRVLSDRSRELLVTEIEPVSGHGEWDADPVFSYSGRDIPGRIAVLTRASIVPSKIVDFWRNVPTVRESLTGVEGLELRFGFGELPLVRQATFSIWSSLRAMQEFAYRRPEHRAAIEMARERKWYSEELFARFRVLGSFGEWEGVNYDSILC